MKPLVLSSSSSSSSSSLSSSSISSLAVIASTLIFVLSSQTGLLAFIIDAQLQPTPSTLQQQEDLVFQPALIGFRCEGSNEVTLDGVVVIEANSPVRVTLYGEAFTTETIVGFTTEFAPKLDSADQVIRANQRSKRQVTSTSTTSTTSTITTTTTSDLSTQLSASRVATLEEPPPITTISYNFQNTTSHKNKSLDYARPARRAGSRSSLSSSLSSLSGRLVTGLTEADQRTKERKHTRRLLDRSYDCTDYDRVISYKLQEDNIITPNVAVLTISLPELDTSGMYYYFCVKQPLLNADGPARNGQSQWTDERTTPHGALTSGTGTSVAPGFQPKTSTTTNASTAGARRRQEPLFWVHQGDEWWLMIKVEPPILSIANDCVLIVLLLFLSAVTSGLNLGLMSLDMNELAVISACGDQRERSYARSIMPLRKRGNYLLCSLLLGNVMVNSTLTVILEEMTTGLIAVIGSTLAIVVLGEIVPQAFCARQGLAIGARTIYLTYAFMLVTFPLSFPISCLLDCVLGEEKCNVYDRERLMEFIRITGNHTQLDPDEVAIISGALKIKKIKVDQIMTRIEDVFMLPIDCMLDRRTIRSIIEKGYSRIPIYEFNDRKQIVALILAKDLALLDPDDQMPLANMLMYCKHPLVFIEDTATLDVALNEFKTGKSHMAIVRQIYDDGEVDKYYEAIGVVTLEDVIEEVLQTEINDETDTLSDNRRKRRRTDAQVAHLVDELIGSGCSPTTAAAVAPNLKSIMASAHQQQQQAMRGGGGGGGGVDKEQQQQQQQAQPQAQAQQPGASLSQTKF